jgi:DNA-binding transcriptional LysR family regulator
MVDWDNLRYALALARAGRASKAGEELGVASSTVLRRVKDLEQQLGVRLFDLIGHEYFKTEIGERVVRTAQLMATEVWHVQDDLEKAPPLAGTLRIMMSEDLMAGIFDPYFAQFCEDHPGVRLDLIIRDGNLSTGLLQADVSVRTVPPREEASEVGEKICDVAWSCYVCERYRERGDWPAEPMNLDEHVVMMPIDRPRVRRWIQGMHLTILPHHRSTSLFTLRQLALYGRGIAVIPCFVAESSNPGLTRLFDPIDSLSEALWIVCHHDLRRTPLVQAFFRIFGELKPVDLGQVQVVGLPPRVRTQEQTGGQGIRSYLPGN